METTEVWVTLMKTRINSPGTNMALVSHPLFVCRVLINTAGGCELTQQHGDGRTTVDRQDRLGPAFGQRPQPRALAGRHHDGLHH